MVFRIIYRAIPIENIATDFLSMFTLILFDILLPNNTPIPWKSILIIIRGKTSAKLTSK
ncbi:MAG: hypothetical protein RR645_04040 [Clostridium sp.]